APRPSSCRARRIPPAIFPQISKTQCSLLPTRKPICLREHLEGHPGNPRDFRRRRGDRRFAGRLLESRGATSGEYCGKRRAQTKSATVPWTWRAPRPSRTPSSPRPTFSVAQRVFESAQRGIKTHAGTVRSDRKNHERRPAAHPGFFAIRRSADSRRTRRYPRTHPRRTLTRPANALRRPAQAAPEQPATRPDQRDAGQGAATLTNRTRFKRRLPRLTKLYSWSIGKAPNDHRIGLTRLWRHIRAFGFRSLESK